jgi:hypothetical protein
LGWETQIERLTESSTKLTAVAKLEERVSAQRLSKLIDAPDRGA